jgi:putative methionine-R-sulfoxide reductase with GAF domain
MSALLTPASIEADCATLVESLSTLVRCARVSSSTTAGGGREDENKPSSTIVAPALVPAVAERLIASASSLAGAAAERREPVELCNLQQDLGGVARPDARETKVSGSLAVPVFSPDGGRVLGTLGIGMQDPHDFTEEEKSRLAGIAATVGRHWAAN